MAFVYEAIPAARREELRQFGLAGDSFAHWVVDADRDAFMVEARMEPPPQKMAAEYPVRFFLRVEGKVIVLDAFRSRGTRPRDSQGDSLRWYIDNLLAPKKFSKRSDEMLTLVSDALRAYRDSEKRERVVDVEVIAGKQSFYGIMGWRRACPYLFRSGRQRTRSAPAFLSGFIDEPIPREERRRLGPLENVCGRTERWTINRGMNAILLECPPRRKDPKCFAFIRNRIVILVFGIEYTPLVPYLNECDAKAKIPFRPVMERTLWCGPNWYTGGRLVIPETERARTDEHARLVNEALTARYAVPRDFDKKEPVCNSHIAIDRCEYYGESAGELCRSVFPSLYSAFHNEPLPHERPETAMLRKALPTFNHEFVGGYVNAEPRIEGESEWDWLLWTADDESERAIVWLGPIAGDKERRLPELPKYCLQSGQERFAVSFMGQTAFLDAFFHSTCSGSSDKGMRMYWHGGIAHLPVSLKNYEADIRAMLAEALRAHGRYYRPETAGEVTLDIWEVWHHQALGDASAPPSERTRVETVEMPHRAAMKDARQLDLKREPIPPEELPRLAPLCEGKFDAKYWLRDDTAGVACIHVSQPWAFRGEYNGDERDAYVLLVGDVFLSISGITMHGTSEYPGKVVFFEEMTIDKSTERWNERFPDALRIFQACLAAEMECPAANVQLKACEP